MKVGPIGVGEWVRLAAARQPERLCVVDGDVGTEQTFAETNARVNRLASAMLANGVRKGDRVGILAVDSFRYLESILACARIGAVFVPLNVRLTDTELATFTAKAELSLLFHSRRYASTAGYLQSLASRPLLTVSFEDDGSGRWYEDLASSGDRADIEARVEDDDVLALVFTSGTTGSPKGVLQSQRMFKNKTLTAVINYGLTPEEFFHTGSSLFHTAGFSLVLMGVYLGYPNLLLGQFDPQRLAAWLGRDELTALYLVPTMLDRLLAEPAVGEGSYTNLRTLLYGAAPMPPELLGRAMSILGCEFVQTFGAGTEHAAQAILGREDHRRAAAGETHLLGSIGRPAIGVDLRLCDGDMKDVGVGEVGEITTRSDAVMSGYLDNPEATARSLDGEWFRAGDLARMDENGYLYLAGRKSDMIIRGGENIYPVEIESVLAGHPGVLQVAVVGVAHPEWGEIVRAYLAIEPGADPPATGDLADYCRERLASYKVPTEWAFRASLPTNASGKVVKRDLT